MQDFEKLGVFYLGKAYDPEQGKLLDDLVLYKSKDLTTHAVIIGMTGSGKTGLGIGILEEAAIDRIPVIAIDPKGDLGNMALTFPDLRPEDFRPWINLHEAANKGYNPDDYAAAQAELWQKEIYS
jgi:DNA helicase HerA-like ATPase